MEEDLEKERRIRKKISGKTQAIKKQVKVIYFAYRNPAVGILPRVLGFLTIAYALSPIDLIPDFIPVLGLLDDLVILPVLAALTLRAIPPEVMREAEMLAESRDEKLGKRWVLVPLILALWVLAIFVLLRLFLKGH